MKQVDQTIFGGTKGNCFAACVASLFEMPIEDVPNFCAMRIDGSGDWMDFFQDWLGKLGLFAFEVNRYGNDKFTLSLMPDGMPLIISGKSPRGDFLHSAIGKAEGCSVKLLHDPHPDRKFFDGPITSIMCLAALPSLLVDLRNAANKIPCEELVQ